jgi:hypothetical protein
LNQHSKQKSIILTKKNKNMTEEKIEEAVVLGETPATPDVVPEVAPEVAPEGAQEAPVVAPAGNPE